MADFTARAERKAPLGPSLSRFGRTTALGRPSIMTGLCGENALGSAFHRFLLLGGKGACLAKIEINPAPEVLKTQYNLVTDGQTTSGHLEQSAS